MSITKVRKVDTDFFDMLPLSNNYSLGYKVKTYQNLTYMDEICIICHSEGVLLLTLPFRVHPSDLEFLLKNVRNLIDMQEKSLTFCKELKEYDT